MPAVKHALILLFILLFSCSNQQPVTSEDTANETTESTPNADQEVYAETELTQAEATILQNIKGNYFKLQQQENSLFYQEDCAYHTGYLQISKKLDEMNFWEIYWLNDILDIHKVEEKEESIYITAHADEANVFILSKNQNEHVWELALSGYTETTFLTHTDHVSTFETKPCTDISSIGA